MSQILLPHAPALPLADFAAGPFGESSRLTALGGWRQSTLEESNAEWMYRKQAKPALLPLSPRHVQTSPRSWPRMQPVMDRSRTRRARPAGTQPKAQHRPRPAAHLPSSDSACESEKRPAKGRERLQRASGAGEPPLPAGSRCLQPPRRRPRPEG